MVNKGTFSPAVKALEAQLKLEILDQVTELAVDRGGWFIQLNSIQVDWGGGGVIQLNSI